MNSDNDLQTLLVERVSTIFNGVTLPNQNGDATAIKVFAQELPSPTDEDEGDPELLAAPYVIVRISEGSFSAWNYTRSVSTVLIFCVYDDSEKKTGSAKILSLMNEVFDNIASDPNVGTFHVNLPIEWSVRTDVDTHPFYFGAMQLDFEGAGREIKLDALT